MHYIRTAKVKSFCHYCKKWKIFKNQKYLANTIVKHNIISENICVKCLTKILLECIPHSTGSNLKDVLIRLKENNICLPYVKKMAKQYKIKI